MPNIWAREARSVRLHLYTFRDGMMYRYSDNLDGRSCRGGIEGKGSPGHVNAFDTTQIELTALGPHRTSSAPCWAPSTYSRQLYFTGN